MFRRIPPINFEGVGVQQVHEYGNINRNVSARLEEKCLQVKLESSHCHRKSCSILYIDTIRGDTFGVVMDQTNTKSNNWVMSMALSGDNMKFINKIRIIYDAENPSAAEHVPIFLWSRNIA